MQATINADLVKKLAPKEKPFDVWDNTLKGFIVRVQPSGIKTYIVEYARHKRITIGQISAISTSDARKEAAKRIAGYIQGNDSQEEKKAKNALTFEEFMNERYAPWCKLHHRRPTDTTRMLERSYPYIGNRKLAEIDALSIERFRSTLLKTIKPVIVNKTLAVLRAAFYKAIDWELLKEHPMRKIKPIRVDDATRIRYLTPDENQRLREALDARETKLRHERSCANKWRRERGLNEHPDYGMFTDYLKPITLSPMEKCFLLIVAVDIRY